MKTKPTERRRYENQRGLKPPPYVSIKSLRKVSGLTLDQLAMRIEQITGDLPTRGALSAVENGHRGASAELLQAIEQAYGLEAGSIDTQYRPRLTGLIPT
ncbi:helix-turn-helix transcriptional regulator [Rhodococcus sp. IEGM 1366]|uniref:helix-turn-helix domain-containing protein n=1 Tax=Rhodococcus sp. IEGM 1366 TaxID=3082223 RepID=UPI0029534BC9|nr:helix-turn-helix transcriptional regulator [Rhodococcus sp. IEGM 1366]MDV8066421.1 helix-turn-helix transcriptional regulator [Rhodococcus sp. IEGM 1366]